jgi:hypothetical protein
MVGIWWVEQVIVTELRGEAAKPARFRMEGSDRKNNLALQSYKGFARIKCWPVVHQAPIRAQYGDVISRMTRGRGAKWSMESISMVWIERGFSI